MEISACYVSDVHLGSCLNPTTNKIEGGLSELEYLKGVFGSQKGSQEKDGSHILLAKPLTHLNSYVSGIKEVFNLHYCDSPAQ